MGRKGVAGRVGTLRRDGWIIGVEICFWVVGLARRGKGFVPELSVA